MIFSRIPAPARRAFSVTRTVTACVFACALVGILVPGIAETAGMGTTLYQRIRSLSLRERLLNKDYNLVTDLPLKEFVIGNEIPTDAGDIELSDIDPLLRGSDEPCDEDPILCPEIREQVSSLILFEQWLRSLGNDLQVIATSYEAPLLGDSTLPITARMQAIGQMWKADVGEDDPSAASNIQFRLADSGAVEGAIQDLGNTLHQLVRDNGEGFDDETMLTAAVWRYRFGGDSWVAENDVPEENPQPEQALLHERFPEVEQGLRDVHESIISSLGGDLPGDGQSMVFTFPSSLIKENFPENIRLWAFVERTADSELRSDAGLQFENTTEPVQPLLCERPEGAQGEPGDGSCKPILGGRFPPQRNKNAGYALCNLPLMKSGYLCSPIKKSSTEECENALDPDQEGTQLTRCESGEKPLETQTGGDVCEDPSWQRGANDIENPDYWNTHCKIKLECRDSGDEYRTGPDPKQSDGTIVVFMTPNPRIAPAHFLLGGLAVAQYECNVPPGATPDTVQQSSQEVFCQQYISVMRVTCAAMAEDGIFEYARQQGFDFPLNIESCASLVTDNDTRARVRGNESTGEQGVCPGFITEHLSDVKVRELSTNFSRITRDWVNEQNDKADAEGTPEKRLAETCEEIINPPEGQVRDPRIVAAIRALERSGNEVCTPLTETRYRNSIGNNVCYLNRCLQQSLEDHRLTPGRTPFNEGDLAYPYDLCLLPAKPLMPVIPTISAESDWTPPPYRPWSLVQYVREQLCPGAGAGTPLCTSDPFRRLNLAPRDLLELVNDAEQQQVDYQESGLMFRQLGEAIGSRIGNRLYGEYLKKRAQTLTDFVRTAATLLLQFPKATFPDAVCPTDSADILALCRENWARNTPDSVQ